VCSPVKKGSIPADIPAGYVTVTTMGGLDQYSPAGGCTIGGSILKHPYLALSPIVWLERYEIKCYLIIDFINWYQWVRNATQAKANEIYIKRMGERGYLVNEYVRFPKHKQSEMLLKGATEVIPSEEETLGFLLGHAKHWREGCGTELAAGRTEKKEVVFCAREVEVEFKTW
jgi:hypothetical protein